MYLHFDVIPFFIHYLWTVIYIYIYILLMDRCLMAFTIPIKKRWLWWFSLVGLNSMLFLSRIYIYIYIYIYMCVCVCVCVYRLQQKLLSFFKYFRFKTWLIFFKSFIYIYIYIYIYSTPHESDKAQGQLLSEIYQVGSQSFPSRMVAIPRWKSSVCPTIYLYLEEE